MTDTVELWSPITDDGVRMTPGELIVEFMDLISDRNSQTGNPYLYVMPLPNMVVIDTPLECERLQGFPDGWTDIPGASGSARYKALGNSVAIPCVEFIMSRIAAALL